MELSMSSENNYTCFSDLGLSEEVLKAVDDYGYKQPSPIQQQSIPHILKNRDVLGLAQTGTGKTAAFALPLISKIDAKNRSPQVLVIAPTRELAIQVAESFKAYGKHIKGFQSIAIYGGQDMRQQLRALSNGCHVVVGTPGRVMDHFRRKSLNVNSVKAVVLDEADEMLRMGFLDDVEWIMQQLPSSKQTALFSATMPSTIKKITAKYLKNPAYVEIKAKTSTVEKIEQKLCVVARHQKSNALLRILEVEKFSAMIIFVATKTATVDVAERINKSGFSAAALNGDMNQIAREKVIKKLKNESLNVVVATDVAARGLDVERISHVINYDIPFDSESYTHRIGRTGRAGRSGTAILLATHRERNIVQNIERNTGCKIINMSVPRIEDIKEVRIQKFIDDILAIEQNSVKSTELDELLTRVKQLDQLDSDTIIKSLFAIIQKFRPIITKEVEDTFTKEASARNNRPRSNNTNTNTNSYKNENMTKYRVSVGRDDGISPGDLVGAIANSSGISSKNIGQIKLGRESSFIWLANDLSRATLSLLKKTRVRNKIMGLTTYKDTHRRSFDYNSKSPAASKSGRIVKRKYSYS
jgi:ATP-dependent RNA helicase DeaD